MTILGLTLFYYMYIFFHFTEGRWVGVGNALICNKNNGSFFSYSIYISKLECVYELCDLFERDVKEENQETWYILFSILQVVDIDYIKLA